MWREILYVDTIWVRSWSRHLPPPDRRNPAMPLQGDCRQVVPDEHSDALRMLDERRNNLSANRTRTVNQLHALLRELLAGGAPTSLTANTAAAVLRGFRARTLSDRVCVGLCKDLIADVRRLDQQLATNQKDLDGLLDEHGTRLRTIDGIGPVLAARLIGRTGLATRFATAAAYATYNGTAPVEIASADHRVHRLSRYGDRQLNAAIHTIAMVQVVRMPGSAGRAYYDRRIAAGTSPRSAMRCLKRYLSNVIWRIMTADDIRRRRHTTESSSTP